MNEPNCAAKATYTGTITIEPHSRNRVGFFESLFRLLRSVAINRALIFSLYKRDYFVAHRKSFLGLTWLIFNPFLGVAAWLFFNATGVLDTGMNEIPYPVYLLTGTSIWALFVGGFGAGSGTLSASASLSLQIKIPREVFLFKNSLEQLSNITIGLVLNIIVYAIYQFVPSIEVILLPILIFPLFLLGISIGLVSSILATAVPDIGRLTSVAINFLFFITPVLYDSKSKAWLLQDINYFNPLTHLVVFPRDLILHGASGNLREYLIASTLVAVLFCFSWRFFFLTEERLSERIG